MTIATINEWRCDMGCGETYQSEERWQPEGWLRVEFATFGEKPSHKHICPNCLPRFKQALEPEQAQENRG